MSSLELPTFDLLTHQASPYDGFGPVAVNDPAIRADLELAVKNARRRILQHGFEGLEEEPSDWGAALDRAVAGMWAQGWNPEVSSYDLFSTDFGLMLMVEIESQYDGDLVVRPSASLSHLSFHWPESQVEAFPFHRAIRILVEAESESMASFVAGLAAYAKPTAP